MYVSVWIYVRTRMSLYGIDAIWLLIVVRYTCMSFLSLMTNPIAVRMVAVCLCMYMCVYGYIYIYINIYICVLCLLIVLRYTCMGFFSLMTAMIVGTDGGCVCMCVYVHP
jgi:hypothetical protein